MLRKLIIVAALSAFATTNLASAYDEVDCSTDSVFSENSCNQCFNGWEVTSDSPLGFFTDIWSNKTTSDKVLYKEEQVMPTFNALNGTKVDQNPQDDSFWQYTTDFDAYASQTMSGYVLPAGKDVTWLKSADGAWIKLSNLPNKWTNAWVMVFEILSHPVTGSWVVDATNVDTHKECVVYKSWEEAVVVPPSDTSTPPTPPTPKELTKVQTWPGEVAVTIIIAMLLTLALLNRRVILAKIKK